MPTRAYRKAGLVASRVGGACLVATMAAIHLYLWSYGYWSIPIIGTLFLLNGVTGSALALALLAAPIQCLTVVAGASVLLTAGTLGALGVSLTVGLFGFVESFAAPLIVPTIAVESAAVLVLTGLAAWVFASWPVSRGSRSS